MNSPEPTSLDFLTTVAKRRVWGGAKRWWAAVAGVLVAVLIGLRFFSPSRDGDPAAHYVSEEVVIGKLTVTVSASGTLQPTKSVDVGSELSGTLESVLVQENERVKAGQVLAQLKTSMLLEQVAKSKAAVAAAQAAVAQMEATVAESRATLGRLRQVAELSGGKVPSKSELDTAQASYQRALANEASARAATNQALAALKSDETNIDKATIRSPINGVVLSRKVEPGQTVAAAMTTPVLFSIAQDLTQMELQVKVDEADVGSVKEGQSAEFTVSAWPGRRFPATIQRVGMGSTTTDNVVTYKTVLKVANDDLALRPGMTANATIFTATKENALLVPNAALRFTPLKSTQSKEGGSFVASLLPRPPLQPQRSRRADSASPEVWVLRDGKPVAIALKTGLTNGRQTEVLAGELKAGDAVITEYQELRK